MSVATRISVPGENAPLVLAFALTFVGVGSATGSAAAWSRAASSSPELRTGLAPPLVSSVATPSTLTSSPSVAALPSSASAIAPALIGSAAPASSSSVAPPSSVASPATPGSKCPPLIVNFKMGMVSPPISARPAFAALAAWLKEHDKATVVIDGHADSSGWEDANLHLSRQRAQYASTALEQAGVAKARITTRGFGSFWPVDETPPDTSWNRRVVIHTKGDACPREREEVIEP